MLTRLKVQGFKNLVDVELRLGPLTCVAGPNGVGKSNIFDAIRFLSMLADKPFVEAAAAVRSGTDLVALFTAGGDGSMLIECDVLIPRLGRDDFGQPAEASTTFLTYVLELRLDTSGGAPRIELTREELRYVRKGDAKQRLGFPCSPAWLDSVVASGKRTVGYISTVEEKIVLSADRMKGHGKQAGGGKPQAFAARNLPRTVLSSAQTADENRTAVLLRHEMRRWVQLQLEPTALREPDQFHNQTALASSGAHLASTLYRLATQSEDVDATYAMIANRLSQLVEGVRAVRVERDEGRRVLRFMMTDRRGVELPAASLSDGTMRFVALSILEADPEMTGLVCLEEPENGIHPLRVPAMQRLLGDMAVDPDEPIGPSNPLRQVITSTHSPLVVASAATQDVVFANTTTHSLDRLVDGLAFRGMERSWRQKIEGDAVSAGEIWQYLGATVADARDSDNDGRRTVASAVQLGLFGDASRAHDRERAP